VYGLSCFSVPKCVGWCGTVSCKIRCRDISENVFQMVFEKLLPKLLQVKDGNLQLDPKIFGSGAQLSTLNIVQWTSLKIRTKERKSAWFQGVSNQRVTLWKFLTWMNYRKYLFRKNNMNECPNKYLNRKSCDYSHICLAWHSDTLMKKWQNIFVKE